MKMPVEYHVMLPMDKGMKGSGIRLVQEWLCFHDCHCRIDADFGPATQAAVRKFQTKVKIHATGMVDEATMRILIAPMAKSLRRLSTTAESFSERIVAAARQHSKWQPKEIGGPNSGPWVRLYAGETDAPVTAWNCAFAMFVMRQAQDKRRKRRAPIKGGMVCNEIVNQAREAQIFVPEELVKNGTISKNELGPGTIFVQRNSKNTTEWSHIGIVTSFYQDFMETIEGNVNDGQGGGSEVCKRVRGYSGIDFLKM